VARRLLPRPPSIVVVVARRLAGLDREIDIPVGEGGRHLRHRLRGRRVLLLRRSALESDRQDRSRRGEAGYEQVAARAREQLPSDRRDVDCDVGLSHLCDARWHFNGEVPVIQINERGRFQGFGDPGMKAIKDHPGLYARASRTSPAAVGSHHREAAAAGAGRRSCAAW